MKKYGILVPFDSTYIWVTDGKDKPIMFDSITEANEYAKNVWKAYSIKRLPEELANDQSRST